MHNELINSLTEAKHITVSNTVQPHRRSHCHRHGTGCLDQDN